MYIRKFVIAVLLLFFSFQARAIDFFPTESGKEIEIQIAAILETKLKVNSLIETVNGNPDDVIVKTIFSENKGRGLPKKAIVTDTSVLVKDQKGQPLSQVINFSSIPNVQLKTEDELSLLRYANKWNSQHFPVRVFIAGNKIVASINIVTTRTQPVSDERVVAGFLSVAGVWGSILDDLKKLNLIINK